MFVFALKYHYSIASSDDLEWILKPTAKLVETILNKPFIKESSTGYVNWEYNIIIAKSCAGINFFITAFCMQTFGSIKKIKILFKQLSFIIQHMIIIYILTILVNTFRIIISIWLLNADIYSKWLTKDQVHKITGIIIFFSSLCVLYIISKKISGKHKIIQSYLRPLAWYLIVIVLIPMIRGWGTNFNNQFLKHSFIVILISFIIIFFFSSIQYIYEKTKNKSIRTKIH
jgi:exosortase K